MRRREIAREIRKAAREWGTSWDDTGDTEMIECHREDARDLMRVAKLVEVGRFQKARDACEMDTIVREQLPSEFFDLLEKKGIPW